ncbi:MAG: FAD-dependent oxidoreductase [Planctomycetota bacterium]
MSDDRSAGSPGIVGIVGGGLAGLAAAERLRAAGVEVRVFDKGRGPGGRASTRRHDADDRALTFDHGAQYFTVRDDRFAAVVDRWVEAGAAQQWTGTIVAIDAPGEATPKPDGPARYVGTPGMNAIVKRTAKDLAVRFGVRVAAIERDGVGWLLSGKDGESLLRCDAVVVAVPAPQAAALLVAMPALQRVATSIDMAPCWAAMIESAEPIAAPGDGLFVNIEGNPLSWASREASKPGRAPGQRWVLHAGGDWSRASIDREPADVAGDLVDAFASALDVERPLIVHAAAHRWRYALAGGDALEAPLHGDGLALAGDWCRGGRIEGAYLSGIDAAERLLGT